MFLIKKELETVVLDEVVNRVVSNKKDIVTQIIKESIDLMRGYLSNHYDAEAIFSAEKENRSLVVLKYLKDIVIHEIYIRRTHEYNEAAKMRYNEAILWLEKAAKGMLNLELTRKKDTQGVEDTFIGFGGRKKYKTGW